jgi:hypothetical protein
MKDKYSGLAQKTSNIREIHVKIIPMIVSSLGAVHSRSLEALRNLLLCDDRAMRKLKDGYQKRQLWDRYRYGEDMQQKCYMRRIFERYE